MRRFWCPAARARGPGDPERELCGANVPKPSQTPTVIATRRRPEFSGPPTPMAVLRDPAGPRADQRVFLRSASFVTHVLADEGSAATAPSRLSFEIMAPLACGVMTGAGAVINSLEVRPGQSIAIFGTGVVGLSAVMAAKIVGATRIIAVDVVPARLALAMELGATDSIDAFRRSQRKSSRSERGTASISLLTQHARRRSLRRRWKASRRGEWRASSALHFSLDAGTCFRFSPGTRCVGSSVATAHRGCSFRC